CDTTDVNQVQTWINGSAYDVRGDIDLNGAVNSTDKSTIQTYYQGTTGGRGALSNNPENRKGCAAYEYDTNLFGTYHVRHRVYQAGTERWLSRDPLIYDEGLNLFAYVGEAPIVHA